MSKLVCAIVLGLLVVSSAGLWAADINGTLYFTTFGGGNNVHSVTYDYNGGVFALGSVANLTPTPGADGILFDPKNGKLVIGGQSTSFVSEEATTGGPVTNVHVGSAGQSYHLAVTSDNNNIWNLPNGGSNFISVIGLPFGPNGTSFPVTGPDKDIRGVVWNPVTKQYYYSSACDSCQGNFGTIVFNGSSFVTTQIATGLWAHGITFDPFTGDMIVNSGNFIQQITTAGVVVGTVSRANGEFDQAAVDGMGHLFVASNDGHLEFVDYAATGNIGTATFKTDPFLANTLDDIAPLSGSGSQTPEPATLMMFGSGVIGLAGVLRRKLKQ